MIAEIMGRDGLVENTIISTPEFVKSQYPGRWREYIQPSHNVGVDIQEAKALSIVNIKAEAERRITALDWRLQRAQERERLGETGVETVADVLALREQIRQASNAAELAVSTLTDVSAVQAFTW